MVRIVSQVELKISIEIIIITAFYFSLFWWNLRWNLYKKYKNTNVKFLMEWLREDYGKIKEKKKTRKVIVILW